jgi:hypothetical protein
MRARSAKMFKNICVRTTCLLQGVREDGEPLGIQRAFRQLSLVIGGLGEPDHQSVLPDKDGTVEGNSTEGEWAADVTK